MSRIRTVKPEFWVSEQVVACSPEARLLFIGMFNFSDDNGIHPVSYVRLKAEVYPCDNFTIDQIKLWVNQLLSNGLLREYEVEDQLYWIITGWKKHQKIDRPTQKYPLPLSELKKIGDSLMRTRALTRDLDEASPPEWKGKEGKGRDKELCEAEASPHESSEPSPMNKSPSDQVVEVFTHWQTVMQRHKARLDKKRKRIILAVMKSGYSVEDLKQAIDGCAATPFNMGQNDQHQRYDSIDLIFRDAEHIERFMANAKNPPSSGKAEGRSQPDWMEGAL